MMEKIFKDEGQPLFGRDDCTIRLQPFTTTTMREILGDYKADYTNEDLLALWTITGGVTGDFPNADYAADHTLNMPMHQSLTDDDLKFIIEKVGEFDSLFCR